MRASARGVRRRLELTHGLAQRAAHLWEPLRAEQKEQHGKDDEHLRPPDAAFEHLIPPRGPAKREPPASLAGAGFADEARFRSLCRFYRKGARGRYRAS